MDKLNEFIKQRDAAYLERFCQKGSYLSDGKNTIMFVCKPVDANDALEFMHQWDAVLVETLK